MHSGVQVRSEGMLTLVGEREPTCGMHSRVPGAHKTMIAGENGVNKCYSHASRC